MRLAAAESAAPSSPSFWVVNFFKKISLNSWVEDDQQNGAAKEPDKRATLKNTKKSSRNENFTKIMPFFVYFMDIIGNAELKKEKSLENTSVTCGRVQLIYVRPCEHKHKRRRRRLRPPKWRSRRRRRRSSRCPWSTPEPTIGRSKPGCRRKNHCGCQKSFQIAS